MDKPLWGLRVQAPFGARFQRVQRGRVLRIDRPLAGGFLSLTGPLAPRVVVSPLWAMRMKSALRDLLFVSYGMISILRIGSLRSPPPIRLRRTSPPIQGAE